jgi:drug/metabolite transporter (DMT)-like permease
MYSSSYQKITGFSMAIASAIFWGISGTCAQFLFQTKGVDPAWLVTWRMLLAGTLLVLYSIAKEKKAALGIWKTPKNAGKLVLFGILGMVSVQYTYFYSISLSNAATATILQYIGPVFVLGFYAVKNKTWPVLGEYLALIFALAGTFLLVTHGSTETLVISNEALVWGILSALALAFYTIQPVGLLRSFSPAAITGWGMLVGGIVLSIGTQPWSFSGTWDGETWLAFAYIVLFGTVLAFYFFLTAVSKIGATFASLLCSVEPLAATLTALLWLGISFSGYDWAGTILILSTVALLTLSKEKKKEP